MRPKGHDMLLERRTSVGVVIGANILVIGSQRSLRVHDKASIFGQKNHGVWLCSRTVLPGVSRSYEVLLILSEARVFQYPFQNHFAPISERLARSLECLG